MLSTSATDVIGDVTISNFSCTRPEEAKPMVHSKQSAMAFLDAGVVPDEYVPAPQALHVVMPRSSWYMPSTHVEHADMPSSSPYVPAIHATHKNLPGIGWNEP
jgi:hypothetical protein